MFKPNSTTLKRNKKTFTSSPKIDEYLLQNGFNDEEIHAILNPCMPHSFHLLSDADKFAEYMSNMPKNSRIHIVGDYDNDGVCSTSILYLTFKKLGFENVSFTIPHRIHDGYGLNDSIVNNIKDSTDILITCDNGVSSHNALKLAKKAGLKVCVTDHHTIDLSQFDALVSAVDFLVHPTLGDYPFPDISGATVTYKLALAMLEKFDIHDETFESYLLQLAAITIVSDVMPVASKGEKAALNENRYLLQKGIQTLRTTPDWHFQCFFDMFKLDYKNLDETMIGFYISPVVNAVGRLTSAKEAVNFFIAETENQAILQASLMGFLNEERKKLKKECLNRVTKSLDTSQDAIIVRDNDIHEGIVGIIAGGLAKDYDKPSFVFAPCEINGQKAWKGSARSTESIHLYNALYEIKMNHPEYMSAFGGHAGAAGLTVPDAYFGQFEKEVQLVINNTPKVQTTKNFLYILASDIDSVSKALMEIKPLGNGLPKPLIQTDMYINKIDLFYASTHVKLSNTFNNEIWLYNSLDSFVNKPENLNGFIMTSDNTARRISNYSMNIEEAKAGRCERWNATSDARPVFTFYAELDYGPFMNHVSPILSVLDYKRKK